VARLACPAVGHAGIRHGWPSQPWHTRPLPKGEADTERARVGATIGGHGLPHQAPRAVGWPRGRVRVRRRVADGMIISESEKAGAVCSIPLVWPPVKRLPEKGPSPGRLRPAARLWRHAAFPAKCFHINYLDRFESPGRNARRMAKKGPPRWRKRPPGDCRFAIADLRFADGSGGGSDLTTTAWADAPTGHRAVGGRSMASRRCPDALASTAARRRSDEGVQESTERARQAAPGALLAGQRHPAYKSRQTSGACRVAGARCGGPTDTA